MQLIKDTNETEAVKAAIDKIESEKQESDKELEELLKPAAGAVAEGLKEFCRQEERFAAAVNAAGEPYYQYVREALKETLERCRKRGHAEAVNSIDVYNAVLEKYIPGAKIRMEARLVLGDTEQPEQTAATSAGFLDLFSL